MFASLKIPKLRKLPNLQGLRDLANSPRLPDFIRNPFRPVYLIIVATMLAAGLLGMFAPIFVQMMGEKPSKLLALPAAMLFGIMLIYDRKMTLVVILFFRAGIENALTLTQMSAGGVPLGIGGLLNGCVILIAMMLVFEQPGVVPRRAFWAWVPFLVITILELIPSPERGEGVRQTLTLCSFYAMFISGFYCGRTPEEFRSAIKLVVWSSAIPALYTFIDVPLHYYPDFRLKSTFGHPNVLAFYLTVVISLMFYLLQSTPKRTLQWQRVFMVGYLFLLLALLLMTKTRSAWAAVAVGFGLYGLIFDRRYLIYMTFLGGLALFIPGVGSRLFELTSGNEIGSYADLNSFSWRVYLWQSAFKWMQPIGYFIGNGLQSFRHYSITFFPFAGGVNWAPHSVYVQLLFESGLIGMFAYLWLSWRALKGLRPLIRIDKLAAFTLIFVVLSFLICAVSDNMFDYLVYNWYWWFAVGAGSSFGLRAIVQPQRKPVHTGGRVAA